MRSDMSKVIVERPRAYRGHLGRSGCDYPRGKLRHRHRALEDAPRTEAMGRGYAEKSLNENLQPLLRFLRAQVGRPWAKVHSEMAAHLCVKSAVQQHVFDHLRQFVAESVHFVGRVPFARFRSSGPLPLRPGELYVCPRTGLLRRTPGRKRTPAALALDASTYLVKARYEWLRVETRPIASSQKGGEPLDVLAQARVGSRAFAAWYRLRKPPLPWSGERYASSVRSAEPEEVRAVLGRLP